MCCRTRYVANATRIHIISSFEQSEKHIDFAFWQKYRANGVCISTRQGGSFLSPNYIINLYGNVQKHNNI